MTTVTTTDPKPEIADRPAATRTVLVALGLLATASLFPLLVVGAFERLQVALGFGGELAITYLIGGIFATLAIGGLGVAYRRVHPVTLHVPRLVPNRRDLAWIVGGTVLSVVVAIGIEVSGVLLGAEPATNFISAAAVERPLLVYGVALVGVLVVVAPIEEYFYRGIVQGRLRERFGPAVAIGLTSVGFALGHVPSYWIGGSDLLSIGLVVALAAIAAGSVVLGAIYERTENLVVVTLVHGLINVIGISIALLAVLAA